MLSKREREAAAEMLAELEQRRLEVILVPAPDPRHHGHAIRTAVMTNPRWYRRLCRQYPTQRSRPRRRQKPDTAIKRSHVARALAELSKGAVSTEYATRLLPFVRERAGTQRAPAHSGGDIPL